MCVSDLRTCSVSMDVHVVEFTPLVYDSILFGNEQSRYFFRQLFASISGCSLVVGVAAWYG